ncbi:hypothetical protein pipiens_001801 [Culex pipiens pipiens]|uniref:Uncharacterized protein n=1 Tax=Culex pipiens pipiens TaxID=38569 RepID=A0ABD1DTJ2_CULPP
MAEMSPSGGGPPVPAVRTSSLQLPVPQSRPNATTTQAVVHHSATPQQQRNPPSVRAAAAASPAAGHPGFRKSGSTAAAASTGYQQSAERTYRGQMVTTMARSAFRASRSVDDDDGYLV